MKRHAASIILIFLPAMVQAAAGVADVAEDDPGFSLMLMAMLVGFFVILVAALLLFTILVFAAMLAVVAGIVSLSLFAGLYRRSISKGVSTFLSLIFITVGGIAGMLLLLILYMGQGHWVSSFAICLSVIAVGGLAGWVSLLIIKKILQRVLADVR